MKRKKIFMVPVLCSLILATSCNVSSENTGETAEETTMTFAEDYLVTYETVKDDLTDETGDAKDGSLIRVDLKENETSLKSGKDIPKEFVPSDSYGKVYPYYAEYAVEEDGGAINLHAYTEDRMGFTDINGNIICEPVFDTDMDLQAEKFYGVYETDHSVLRGRKAALISRDGSFYSGSYSSDTMVKTEEGDLIVGDYEDGISYADCFSSDGSPVFKDMAIDGKSVDDLDSDWYTSKSLLGEWDDLIDDRYLLTWNYLLDTKTGKIVFDTYDSILGHTDKLFYTGSDVFDIKGNNILHYGNESGCAYSIDGFSEDGHLFLWLYEDHILYIISPEGEVTQYDQIDNCSFGPDKYAVLLGGKVTVYGYDNKVLLEKELDFDPNIVEGPYPGPLLAIGRNYFVTQSSEECIVYDMDGNEVIRELLFYYAEDCRIDDEEGDPIYIVPEKGMMNIKNGKTLLTDIGDPDIERDGDKIYCYYVPDNFTFSNMFTRLKVIDLTEMTLENSLEINRGVLTKRTDKRSGKDYYVGFKATDPKYDKGYNVPLDTLLLYDAENFEQLMEISVGCDIRDVSIEDGMITVYGETKTAVLDLNGNIIFNTPYKTLEE